MFVYLVIDDSPPEFGEREVLGVFSNKKAAVCEVKCLKQIDGYTKQYVKIFREILRNTSIHQPVTKRRP